MSLHPLEDPLILAAPPSIELTALQAALRQDWQIEGRLTALGGERDRNFRLDRDGAASLMIKLAHPDEAPEVTDFQTAALLHLAAADPGLPVPRLVRMRDGRTGRGLPAQDGRLCRLRVLHFLPGQPMTGAVTPMQAQALGALTARLDRAFAGFAHPGDRRRLLWDIRELPGLRRLLPEVPDPALRGLAEAALDRFEATAMPALAALPEQVIHNDLNPHNVLVDAAAGRLSGVIDFGDMLRAPRLQEVATACAYLLLPAAPGRRISPALVEAFLTGHGGGAPLPPRQRALLPLLIGARMALTVLITSWRARRQPENAAYILRNQPGARSGLAALGELAPVLMQ